MKYLLLFAIVLLSYSAHSQSISPESIFSSSGSLSNNFGRISWTLGDLTARTFKDTDIVLTQGFLQSELTITQVISFDDDSDIALRVFPNPVSEILNIKMDADRDKSIHLYIYNLEGQLVYNELIKAKNYTGTINFNPFENGAYFLKAVSDDKKFIKTFKIIYQE